MKQPEVNCPVVQSDYFVCRIERVFVGYLTTLAVADCTASDGSISY
jgi:hypothetical protein